ncbi:DUF4169 family protein [Pseudochelatococcus contaminans]|uniref:DUF4169 family protein n=1 Tax=Pseudochelatococcus contaminans TaxID=1538103 RepID=A0A7W5Z1U4_9HYPH|nr:hypothetical protein [Pseudochelatococcus contaminans]
MAEIINLRRARKARARTEKEAQAAENRLRFGVSALQRRTDADERDKAKRHLDGHRRSDETAEGDKGTPDD